ncbi:MAG: amidohydrolase family protein [Deltaproteobacteria bacterium]|nr:amidohydrolase family protein [Deltaproteobacteria bacterium]MBN2671299.1 amidohydrolase family protein [Deltaproteobacteria bacterium]
MLVDCHVHMACNSQQSSGYTRLKWPQRMGSALMSRRLGTYGACSDEEAERGYIRALSNYILTSELDKAVLLAFDEVYHSSGERSRSLSRFFVPNDYVASVCAQHSTFLFGASVHPFRLDAIDELERLCEKGAVLLKLLPNSHRFDPADARLIPFYRKLASLRLPLLLHGGFEHTIPVSNQSFGDPARFRLALDEGCTVIVAHAGSAGLIHLHETMGAFLRLLRDYPNCYGDTSALTNLWRSKYLRQLLHPERLQHKYGVLIENPFDRMIHGSDYPVPITPMALGWKTSLRARQNLTNANNPIQLDVALKRAAGVPDSCLSRAGQVVRLPSG